MGKLHKLAPQAGNYSRAPEITAAPGDVVALSIEQAAAELGLPQSTLQFWISRKGCPVARKGGRGYVFEAVSTTTVTPEQEAEATAARVLEFIRKEYAAGRKYGKEGLRNSKDQLGLTRGQVDAAIARLESSGAVGQIGGQGKKGSHLAPLNFEGANCDL